MDVSFEASLRHCGDVLLGRCHCIPIRPHHNIPIRRREYVSLRYLGDVPLRRCWVFHLRHTCDVTGTNRETSLRRCHDALLPSGFFQKSKFKIPLSRCYTYYSYMHVCKNVCIQKIIEKAVLKNANLNTNDPYFKMRENI